MVNECDFAFYQEKYGGSLSEAEFMHFIRRAKVALCAIADGLAKEERTDKIQSEKAGQYSVTYRENAKQTDLYSAAAVYLTDGILFRGWGGC